MPTSHDSLVLGALGRIEDKVDVLSERVVRVETLVEERTSRSRRGSTSRVWTTIISGGIVGLWELAKIKWAGKP